MEAEDFIGLPACTGSGYENEDQHKVHEPSKGDSQPATSQDEEDKRDSEKMGRKSDAHFEGGHFMPKENLQTHLVDNDSDMEVEDISFIPALSNSRCGIEENRIHDSTHGIVQTECRPTSANKEGKLVSENLGHDRDGAQCAESHCIPEAILDKDLADKSSLLQMSMKLNETLTVAEKLKARVHPKKGSLAVQDESRLIGTHKTGGSCILPSTLVILRFYSSILSISVQLNNFESLQRWGCQLNSIVQFLMSSIKEISCHFLFTTHKLSLHNSKLQAISGVKRKRVIFDEQQPSICVAYNSLTRLVGAITISKRDRHF